MIIYNTHYTFINEVSAQYSG